MVGCRGGNRYVEWCWDSLTRKSLLVSGFFNFGFLVSLCLGFLVSWFLGFKVSWFQSSKVSKFNDPILPNSHLMFVHRC